MPILPNSRRSLLHLWMSLLVGSGLASFGILTAAVKQPRSAVAQQESIKSDKMNYEGTVVFETADGKKLNGTAYLYLDGRKFVLTYQNEKLEGELYSTVKQGQAGGNIHFKNDRAISIKWTQDPSKPSRLKIVSAKASCIKFRFCSRDVSSNECAGTLGR